MSGAGDSARMCVAAGVSNSQDASLHWLHGLNRSKTVASGREDLNHRLIRDGASSPPSASPPAATQDAVAEDVPAKAPLKPRKAGELTRVYNNFLRHKVFAMMQDICRHRNQSDFAFMMDADTAVNRSNLEAFVSAINPNASIYTGQCKRKAAGPKRQKAGGVGGGPGILFSRPLLDSFCPKLHSCAPLRNMMDRLRLSGGDLMLAKCMEFLGHPCNLENEIPCAASLGAACHLTP